MPNIDKDKKKDKKKPEFNAQAFKHAIGMIESNGGKFMDNPNSSAAGRYHFLYNSIKDDPSMEGVSKREFINRPELQELIMDKALSGNLKGYAYGSDYARGLLRQYPTNHNVDELTALVHFLGPGNTRKYLKDPVNFKAPGINASPQQYVDRFNSHFKTHPSQLEKLKQSDTFSYPSPKKNEMQYAQKVQDNTSVRKPMMYKMLNQLPDQIKTFEGRQDELNNFRTGGSIEGQSGAQELVTIFEEGGSHQENPLGGIPQGVGSNGKPNLVEEGETKWNDYIFSNAYDMEGNFTGEDKVKSNVFESGGELTDPTDPKKNKNTKSPNPTDPVKTPDFGPNPDRGANYPLKITKTQSKFHTKGSNMFVDDNRSKYTGSGGAPFLNDIGEDEVNWDRLNVDDNTNALIQRYNDPWTREKLKEQSGYSDYDIDNMLIRGLEAEEQIGGNVHGSEASYNRDKNIINTGHDHEGDSSVNMHERIHASGLDAVQGLYLGEILGSTFQQKDKTFLKRMDPDIARYLNMPHETYGNFVEFREKLGLKPGEQITLEEMKKRVKAKNLNMSNFYRSFDNDKIIKALNTVASVDNNNNNNTDGYKLA